MIRYDTDSCYAKKVDTTTMVRILSDAHIRQLLTMDDAIRWVRSAFRDLATGTARVPVRSFTPMPEVGAGLLSMPAFRSSDGLLGIKVITLHDRNPPLGLPRSRATVLVIDAEHGHVRGILEGEYLTAVRTGAGSGVATDLLAKPDSRVVAVFGAGKQAETQLEAVCAVRPIESAFVFARSEESARAFAERMNERVEAEIIPQPDRSRIAEADIICAATTSSTPVFNDAELGREVHINGVGSYTPNMVEVPPATVARSYTVMDQREACMAEAGDLIQAVADGLVTSDGLKTELGGLIREADTTPGSARGGHTITFFKSVGNAIQDLAVASELLKVAEAAGVGARVTL